MHSVGEKTKKQKENEKETIVECRPPFGARPLSLTLRSAREEIVRRPRAARQPVRPEDGS